MGAWDSNPVPQDGRRRRNHRAMAAAPAKIFYKNSFLKQNSQSYSLGNFCTNVGSFNFSIWLHLIKAVFKIEKSPYNLLFLKAFENERVDYRATLDWLKFKTNLE